MATLSAAARPRKADAPTPADAAFGALVLFPLALAAVALTLPILAIGFALALPPLLVWRLTGWRVLRLLACLPFAYEAAWYRLHSIDPRPLSAGYLAAQRTGGLALLARLHGADMAAAQALLAQWLADSTALALLLGSFLAVFLAVFPPVFLRRPASVSQEGERGRRAAERDGGTRAGERARTAVRSAPDVLHALARRRTPTVCLAGPHFAVGAVSMMHGPSGVGKSRWLAEVVWALTRGLPVFGWPTVQTPVVWVTEESLVVWQGKGGLLVRDEERGLRWWQRWLRARWPRRYPPTVWPISLPDTGIEPDAQTFPDLLKLVEHVVRRTGAKLVILDTLMAVCPPAVKDNEVAKVFIRRCAGFAHRLDVAIEIVHHDNNEGRPLGAKMLKGAVDYTHHVHLPEDADESDRRRVVEFGKRYEPMPPAPLTYRMRDDGRLEACDDGPDGMAGGRGAAGAAGLEPAARPAAEDASIAGADGRVPQEERDESEAADDASIPRLLAAVPPAPSEEERVLAAVTQMCESEGYATLSQVMLITGLPKTTAWKKLDALRRKGMLEQTKEVSKTASGRWTLAAPL